MQFSFKNKTGALLPFLKEVEFYLLERLYGNSNLGTLLMRGKYILIEMCTNGIKHSGEAYSQFNIDIEDDKLFISKIDKGNPFTPKSKNGMACLVFPPQNLQTYKPVTIWEDDLNRLAVKKASEDTLVFYVEDINEPAPELASLLEKHLGLIIICRAADVLHYKYEPEQKLNIFTAKLQVVS
ncbi:MAG: hypothetical protein J0I41_23065 [Filimonas sp.]|nr:hypothetical protein [Filimonas sp.]